MVDGKQFLSCTQRTLSKLDGGVEELRRVGRGEGLLRLGLLRTLGIEFVPKLAERFLKAHPDKNIRFSFSTGVTRELLEGLRARQYDMVFASRPPIELNLTSVAVSRQDIVLIVPKKHPLAKQHVIDLADTLPYPQVCFSKGSGMRDVVDGLFEKNRRQPGDCHRDAGGSGRRGTGRARLRHCGRALYGSASAAGCTDFADCQTFVGAGVLPDSRQPRLSVARRAQFSRICAGRCLPVKLHSFSQPELNR